MATMPAASTASILIPSSGFPSMGRAGNCAPTPRTQASGSHRREEGVKQRGRDLAITRSRNASQDRIPLVAVLSNPCSRELRLAPRCSPTRSLGRVQDRFIPSVAPAGIFPELDYSDALGIRERERGQRGRGGHQY